MNPHLMSKEKGVNCCKGLIFLFLLLLYHAIEFFLTMSFGIGVGLAAAIVHYSFWYRELERFWQCYITLVVIFLVTELYFRMMQKNKFFMWMNRTQAKYRLLLYYIPRGMYFCLYIVTVVSLYLQYASVHTDEYVVTNDGIEPKSPLRLELDDDHYFRTIFFIMSLAYMEYAITKESDWMTHRLRVMATGESDPIGKGSIGSFLILTGAHLILTALYSLPLLGFVFIFKTFVAGWPETYFIICILAAFIGIFTSFLERQSLFPSIPMNPPNYTYENHLRIRVAFLHYWLIPLAAGRYFNRSHAVVRNATDGDFIVFTMEVAIGVLVASKVISNDIYLLFFEPKPQVETDEPGSPNTEVVQLYENEEGDMSQLASVEELPPEKPQDKDKDKPPVAEMSMGSAGTSQAVLPPVANKSFNAPGSPKPPQEHKSVVSVGSPRKAADQDMSMASIDFGANHPEKTTSLVSIGTNPDLFDEKEMLPVISSNIIPMTSSMEMNPNDNDNTKIDTKEEESSSLFDLMKRLT